MAATLVTTLKRHLPLILLQVNALGGSPNRGALIRREVSIMNDTHTLCILYPSWSKRAENKIDSWSASLMTLLFCRCNFLLLCWQDTTHDSDAFLSWHLLHRHDIQQKQILFPHSFNSPCAEVHSSVGLTPFNCVSLCSNWISPRVIFLLSTSNYAQFKKLP